MENPLVTVLITTYNPKPHHLSDAIRSVLHQTYRPLELLVIDDGSERGTSIIESYLHDCKSSNISARLISYPHKGLPYGLINGIDSANGKYIAILDQDDVLTKNSIIDRIKGFDDTSVGLVYGDVNYIDDSGIVYALQKYGAYNSGSKMIRSLLISPVCPVKHSAAMMRTDAVKYVGNYDSTFDSFFDNELFIRMSKEYRSRYVSEIVTCYRTHESNTSNSTNYRISSILNVIKVIERDIDSPIKRAEYIVLAASITLAKILYMNIFGNKRPSINIHTE